MINSGLLSYLRRAALVLFLPLCLACPGSAVARDVMLRWDKSIDDPYIKSYKVYYYTVSNVKNWLNYDPDGAASCNVYICPDGAGDCTVDVGAPCPTEGSITEGPIIIDKKYTQIKLTLPENNRYYYFVVSSVDIRGLEGVTTNEVSHPLDRLSVVKLGIGRGVLSAAPLGINSDINCGTSCASDNADYAHGASVTLTAAPGSGYGFVGWSGCNHTALLTCTVTMDAPTKTVTAKFAKRGDVNQDDVVNLADAILIHKLMSRTETQPFPEDYIAMNNDGKLGLPDAIYILQKAVGLRY